MRNNFIEFARVYLARRRTFKMKTTYEEIVNVKKIGQKGVSDMTGIVSSI